METKCCTKCSETKPVDEFTPSDRKKPKGGWCRKCKIAYNKEWRQGHIPSAHAQAHLIHYSRWYQMKLKIPTITMEEVATFHELFTGRCDICDREIDGRSKHLDHDDTEKVLRGWLCSNCNMGLGHLKHDEDLLLKAVEYLKRTKNN